MTQSHILTLTLKEQARWFKYTAISVFKQESIEKIIKTWSQEQRSDFTKEIALKKSLCLSGDVFVRVMVDDYFETAKYCLLLKKTVMNKILHDKEHFQENLLLLDSGE
jgi:hypothetical protein